MSRDRWPRHATGKLATKRRQIRIQRRSRLSELRNCGSHNIEKATEAQKWRRARKSSYRISTLSKIDARQTLFSSAFYRTDLVPGSKLKKHAKRRRRSKFRG